MTGASTSVKADEVVATDQNIEDCFFYVVAKHIPAF
ncbi:hypothetical protein LRU_00262 [Ligilactobacillus ruminis SPM0211]|uniref:Uncharacterized protein n=1 Tax=Ligilactobacillus ruminis SPM0211 TaxID=1040964 RepID=F7QXX7_9LACO|nr:hypothetical protein LRU_00262 [Ligilactobacillus ruminis SPM0211]